MADGNVMNAVKKILLSDEARKYVVVSAPGKRFSGDIKVTDLLYLCYAQQAEGVPFDDTFDRIAARYLEIERALATVNPDADVEIAFFGGSFTVYEKHAAGIAA